MAGRFTKLEQRMTDLEARAGYSSRAAYRIPFVVLQDGETEAAAGQRVGADMSQPVPMIILVPVKAIDGKPVC